MGSRRFRDAVLLDGAASRLAWSLTVGAFLVVVGPAPTTPSGASASVAAPSTSSSIDTAITSAPADPTSKASATFAFASTLVGATFQCRLDSGSWSACKSPKSYSWLAPGNHTFTVRAVDATATADDSPAAHTWQVLPASYPLDTWIISGPESRTLATDASFTFVATRDGARFQCKLDGAAWSACTSPKSFSGLSWRRHVFSVRAIDVSGTIDSTPAAFAWRIGSIYTPVEPAGRVRPWTTQFFSREPEPTEEQALADARNFDLLIAHASAYRKYVTKMHAANPELLLIAYMNTTTTYRTDLPESAYAHDADGNRITPREYPTTYLLEPTSAYAAALQQGEATRRLADGGYDGIYCDATGDAAVNLGYITALPINPKTGKTWTKEEWVAAVRDNFVSGIKKVVRSRPMFINSLKDGPAYFDPTNPRSATLTPGLIGSIAESWLRSATAPATEYPSESVWKQNVDMLVDAGNRGFAVFEMTKVWTTVTEAQKTAWYKYTLASYLLGNDGRSWYTLTFSRSDVTDARPWNRLDLGDAKGAYTRLSSGVYQRTFVGGKALVNPTANTVTVSLGATYTTLEGRSVTSVRLAPKSAEIVTG